MPLHLFQGALFHVRLRGTASFGRHQVLDQQVLSADMVADCLTRRDGIKKLLASS